MEEELRLLIVERDAKLFSYENVIVPLLNGRIEELERLVKQFHGARGRYHTQMAYCDLMESMGLPCHRSENEKKDS